MLRFKLKSITAACCILLSLSTSSLNAFTFTQKAVGVDRWIGQWRNASTSISFYKLNYILEVSGSDRISSFKMRCLPTNHWNENTLTCTGSGLLFDEDNPQGVMFMNESIFNYISDNEIKEHWTVRYWSHSDVKIIERSETVKYQKK